MTKSVFMNNNSGSVKSGEKCGSAINARNLYISVSEILAFADLKICHINVASVHVHVDGYTRNGLYICMYL